MYMQISQLYFTPPKHIVLFSYPVELDDDARLAIEVAIVAVDEA